MTLHVRAKAAPGAVLEGVVATLRRLEPQLPLTNALTLADALRESLWAARLGASLLSVFGLLALALAAVGIYGVLAHHVEDRRRELGIRLALGARHRELMLLVVGQGLAPVAIGLVAGTALFWAIGRFAADMLYGVEGNELAVVAGAAVLLGAVAAAACAAPAWRTSRIDPVRTLKSQ